jgi:hypothetical protein
MTGRVTPVMVSELQGDRKPESAGEEFRGAGACAAPGGGSRQLTSTSSWFAPNTNPYVPAANHYLGLQ